MQISVAVRIIAAIFSCSLVAACGGGGGGGGSSPTPVQTPVGPGGGAASRSVVVSDASAVLTAGKLIGDDGYGAGGPPVGAMAVVRHVQSRRTQAVQCQPGGASGVGSVSFASSTDAQGNTTETYSDYYDASCAQIERVATLTYPANSSTSATGTTTEYGKSGAVIGFANVTASWTSSSVTATTADSQTVSGPVVGRSGVTCILASSSTETCGTASFMNVAGTTTGLTGSLTESLTATGQSTGTISAQFTATTYVGSSLALVPPSSGTAWGLSGGTAMDSLSGNGSATVNGSLVTAGTYSMTDSTANISASGSYTGSGPLTITLTQGGTTVATITIDVDGNGTITYADTTKQNVAGFVIFG